MHQPPLPERQRPYTAKTPLAFWVIWALTIAAAAAYTWWGAVSVGAPADIAQIVLRSLIVGVGGLIVLTLIEARIAPWHFL